MKALLILISLLFSQSDCDEINNIRTKYHQVNSEEKLTGYINFVNTIDCEKSIPYKASAKMQSAKYAFWPTKKLKLFNTGKKQLENYITNNPNDIEAKYIRVLIQDNVPKILGYHKNKLDDIAFIKQNLSSSTLPKAYKELILSNISKID